MAMMISLLLACAAVTSDAFRVAMPIRSSRGRAVISVAMLTEDATIQQQLDEMTTRAESAEAAKVDLAAQLETKAEEIAKFVESVETELNEARAKVQSLTSELSAVKAELAERTVDVDNLNTHLEAHTGATRRLNAEVASLTEQLAAAQ